MANRDQESMPGQPDSGRTNRNRALFRYIPGHASTAFVLAGLLVMGAMLSGNAETGHLDLSLALLALAILVVWTKLTTADSLPAPTGVASIGVRSRWMGWAMAVLILLHCGMAWRTVGSSQPLIDSYVFQRDAANDLLHGVDPYGGTRPDIYDAHYTAKFYTPETESNGRVQVGMQYPPVTFLCALPGVLMGDVRYGYIGAIALSVIFLFAAMPDGRGLSLAAILLLNPITLLVEGQSWTEPLVWMLLCATFYTALKRPKWLPVALGLFLASKQYNVIALPLLGYLLKGFDWRAYGRLLCASLLVAATTMLPFAVWNPRGLWHDLVWFHLAQPMRHDAISLAVVFPLALKIGPFLVLAFMAWAAMRAAKRAELFAAAYALALLLLAATSKQAFPNYYFLVAQCFLLSGAALWTERSSRASTPVETTR